MIYLPGILTSLAYLMGEKSVNSSTSGPRTDFVQDSLTDAYRAYPWKFARRSTTLTISSGIATLPTNFDYQMKLNAHYFPDTTTQTDLTEIDALDKASYQQGDNIFYITSPSDGLFLFNTKENISSANFVYQSLPPTLDSAGTVGTPYPNKRTIALGARTYVKLGQNPDADVSQEQAQFDTSLAKDIAEAQVPAPRRKRRTANYQTGSF